MSIAIANLACGAASGNLQGIAAFIFGQFLAGGMVQAADTGQSASGSWPAPSGSNNASGYQIWRFNDSLQNSYPIYIKIELGSGNNSSYPGLWITVGTGTNGSGTVNGSILLPRTQINISNYNFSSNCYISSSINRFVFCLWPNQTTSHMFISLERTKDINGNDTSDGILFLGVGYTSGWVNKYSQFDTSKPNYGPYTYFLVPNGYGVGSLANGPVVGLLPILNFGPAGVVNPGNQTLAYYGPDLSAFNAIPITIHGSPHNYLPLGSASISSVGNMNWTSSTLAMLWE